MGDFINLTPADYTIYDSINDTDFSDQSTHLSKNWGYYSRTLYAEYLDMGNSLGIIPRGLSYYTFPVSTTHIDSGCVPLSLIGSIQLNKLIRHIKDLMLSNTDEFYYLTIEYGTDNILFWDYTGSNVFENNALDLVDLHIDINDNICKVCCTHNLVDIMTNLSHDIEFNIEYVDEQISAYADSGCFGDFYGNNEIFQNKVDKIRRCNDLKIGLAFGIPTVFGITYLIIRFLGWLF